MFITFVGKGKKLAINNELIFIKKYTTMNSISNGVIQVLDQLKANGQLNDYLIDDDERKWTKLVYDIMVNKFDMPFGKGTMEHANEIFNSDVRVWKGKNKLGNMMNMESKNMNKKLIRLTESDLHKIVKESVNRILSEARYAWDLTDNGVDEFNMDVNGFPTPETARRYNSDEGDVGRKIDMARRMGQDHASENDWRRDYKDDTYYNTHDTKRNARNYVEHGKYYPYGFATRVFDDNAEDDLNAFNKAERQKQAAADRRWMKAADSRPLYKKNSPNNDIPR